MDCVSRFNGPLETAQSQLSQMTMNKWYHVDTLEIGQKTTEEQLKRTLRIVSIFEGLTSQLSGCGQKACVQLDQKFYENEEIREVLLRAVKEKKMGLGLAQKKTEPGIQTSSKSKSVAIGVSVSERLSFLLAAANVLFLSNCVFEWPKRKNERREDGKMPIQILFSRAKRKKKTVTKSDKMEKPAKSKPSSLVDEVKKK